jgi:ABC-type dipeptide/oligopeptide/nickel transport system permease subunit
MKTEEIIKGILFPVIIAIVVFLLTLINSEFKIWFTQNWRLLISILAMIIVSLPVVFLYARNGAKSYFNTKYVDLLKEKITKKIILTRLLNKIMQRLI